jgi:aldehyde:ferredoxin oxidoreductase
MKGFYNRVLLIDLNARTFRIETIPDFVYETYLGGKGLASYLLTQLNPVGADPLGPENCLVFATGPVTGSSVWGSCRYGVFTKSPQTGFYSESYAGGKVPEAVDAAGYDAIVIQGRSATPTVLSIQPDGVEFHEAGEIWGMDSFQTQDAVLERFAPRGKKLGKGGAVVIGPAGENLVRFAVIENDYWRSCGRTGVGAVMGSKNLKAILFSGDRRRSLHDEGSLRAFSKALASEAKTNKGVEAYKSMGTTQMVRVMNQANAFPTRYWSKGSYEKWEKISSDALHEQCRVKPNACLKCFMACGRMTEVLHGRHAGLKLEGPEYETIYAFGGLCLIDSIEEIAYLNDLCDRLGMDTITAGNLCAFTIEASRRDKISYRIDYGDVDGIAALLAKIAAREGIGGLLAEGIREAAREWGLEDLAVHVKGLEPAGYEPRVLKGMGLAYATSDRGACHLRTTFYKAELSGMIDPDQIEGKAELFVDFEDRLNIFDALILCRFYRDLYTWDQLEEMIRAVTGLDANSDALKEKAAAISTLVRNFNIREGLRPEDDRLPKKLHQKLEDSEKTITEGELETMLRDYYRLRGWDDQGYPSP